MKRLLVLLCVFVISSCGGSGSSSVPVQIPQPVANTPDTTTYPGVSWDTALPEDVGMSEAQNQRCFRLCICQYSKHSRCCYCSSWSDRWRTLCKQRLEGKFSDKLVHGKSFASALVGIAMDQGLIDSIDVPASNYLAPWVSTDKAEHLNKSHFGNAHWPSRSYPVAMLIFIQVEPMVTNLLMP